MRYIHSQEILEIPEGGRDGTKSLLLEMRDWTGTTGGKYDRSKTCLPAWITHFLRKTKLTLNFFLRIVKVNIKTRIVTVEGPRGKLTKNLGHLAVNFGHPKKNTISIEIHHGNRKNVATLRTVRSIIENLITGVTKGFKYKMRYVYAHFPINVNLDKNKETGLFEVEIRNFIGEKIVRRVTMHEGVDVEISKAQKDELILTGNSLENVSQSAADIQQICRVRNKDIRKFLDGLYVSEKGNVVEEA
ncbi:60S ribosomal protein L9-B [Trichoderma lentiforme]|uniref:60S ribosomal protein L9-B n=1 Tax=Trichoderma lentiforme TaxID=1567552 RepID=A0A9P5CIX2_9HYPO|nr:60S ribosomal protein L9-B [Trichoderma lentiforme]